MSVKDKINFSNVRKADLFISIHIDKEEKKNLHSGINILIPSNDNKYVNQSKLLGSSIMETFRSNYSLSVANDLKQRDYTPWVLKANQCPAIVIEAGFLSSKKDFDYLTKSSSQQAIARNILNGIENYAEQGLSNADSTPEIITADSLIQYLTIRSDSANPVYYIDGKEISKDEKIPSDSIQSITVLKGQNAIKKYGDKGKKGVIEITTKYNIPPNTFIIIDGKESSRDELNKIPRDNIESVTILKGESAIKKYGEKAKYGFIEITTKKASINSSLKDTIPGKKEDAKNTYKITKGILLVSPPDAIQIQADELISTDQDKHRVDPLNAVLIIDGKTVSNQTLRKKWITAKKVTIYQPDKPGLINEYGDKAKNGVIIFEDATVKDTPSRKINTANDTGKIFTKVENAASFPGGPNAWQKYIARCFQASLDSFTTADFGTCILRFIVNTDGTVSDVRATTMKGTQLAKMAVNAVKKGPKWIPASQNGKTVASYRLQPVTLTSPDAFNKTPSKLKQPAGSEDGQVALSKYITRTIQKKPITFRVGDIIRNEIEPE
jgi:hypothetical protein